MFRFLRRVFIILILLIIIFFIFRFVKPEATSRFVDKVKSIPTTISSRFHREKKAEIIINGDTTYTNTNFEINDDDENNNLMYTEENYNTSDNNNNDTIYEESNWEVSDLSRLEELNRELDQILASGNNTSGWTENVSENEWNSTNNNIQTSEITWNTLPSWFVTIDVEQPYEPWDQTPTNTNNNTQINSITGNATTSNNTQSNTTTNNTTTNTTVTPQRWNCWEWLTVQDCEDLMRDFWSFEIN